MDESAFRISFSISWFNCVVLKLHGWGVNALRILSCCLFQEYKLVSADLWRLKILAICATPSADPHIASSHLDLLDPAVRASSRPIKDCASQKHIEMFESRACPINIYTVLYTVTREIFGPKEHDLEPFQ